ncbi:MAG: cobalamin-binding protein [Hyphomicrobium sp.]|jgi:iron complex transport system substrate-binding protein|nr:cobalamin-binding protein [Hyphomicrobium sp.]
MSHPSPLQSQPRVISLIASATEILHALGAGGMQIARSHECDYPPSVLELPQLTRAKFKVHGASSAEIDRSVKGLMQQGLAVYEVDAEKMRDLNPDLILTQDQCEVCAVSLADVERALCSWTGSEARIVSLRPHTLSDVYLDILAIAAAIGRPQAGQDLIHSMRTRLSEIAEAVSDRPKVSLGFVEWIEPPMSGGHWMPELIDIAGGISPFGIAGDNSPWVSWEQFAAADSDILLVAPCGYEIGTSLPELELLRSHPVFKNLRAVREGRVFVADGNAFFNRPGPRLVESAEILAEILHPDVRSYGHLGSAYVVWPS